MKTQDLMVGSLFETERGTFEVTHKARNHIMAQALFTDKTYMFPFGLNVQIEKENEDERESRCS